MIDWSDLSRLRVDGDEKILFVKKQPHGLFLVVYEANNTGLSHIVLVDAHGKADNSDRRRVKMLPRTRKFFAVTFENGVCIETYFSEQSAEHAGEKGMKSGLGRYVIQEFQIEIPEDWK